VLVAKTGLYYFLITNNSSRLKQVALVDANTELAVTVITKGEELTAGCEEAREILSAVDRCDHFITDRVRINSLWSIDSVHVGVALHESWAVLSRSRLTEATLSKEIGAP